MLITTRTEAPAPADAHISHWRALPVLMAGTAMIVLDFFIVNVALPAMQSGLHASATSLEWVVAGYGLTFSTLLITAGRVGDRVGRRRMFSVGLALFALTSAGCGLAPTAGALVVFRFLQGAAAAIISPTVLAIIGVVYTGEDRVRAISIYGVVLGVAAAAGQLLGGLLIQANLFGLGWRAIFLINVPIGLAALILSPRLIPESRAGTGHRLDLGGTILLTAALTAIVLPLVEGRRLGWPAWTWITLAAGPVLLAMFAIHQVRMRRAGRAPLLDMHLFCTRAFSAGLLTQLALWCGQASFFLILALYLQNGRGLDPLAAGTVFTIAAGAYLAASLRAPALTVRWGRRLVAVGALILAAGHGLLLVAVTIEGTRGSIAALAPGLLLVGAGMGLCITPLTTTVLASAGPQSAGAVSGALSTTQQVGNSLGVAVTGVIFFGALSRGYAHAFVLGLMELAVLLVGVAALTRLLPRPAAPATQKGYSEP
jgi:EmrB/QacA subfamily drug resistance transporter